MKVRLEEILRAFEGRLAKCGSASELSATLAELNKTAGFAGRSDPGVPMVDGAVVSAELWKDFEPRFRDLGTRVQQRLQALSRGALEAQRAAHAVTVRLFFPAHFSDPDTDEVLADPALLARCHGVRDATALRGIELQGTSVLTGLIGAVIEFDAENRGLHVVLELPTSTRPTAHQVTLIQSRVEATMYHGWALNPGFDLPAELDAYSLHFDARASRHEVVDRA